MLTDLGACQLGDVVTDPWETLTDMNGTGSVPSQIQ